MLRNAFGITGLAVAAGGVGFAVAGLFTEGETAAALLATGGFLVLFGLIFLATGRRLGRVVMRGRGVLEHGIPGMGTVLEMSETAMTVNEQPVFGYRLAIEAPGLPAFETLVKQVTPRMLAGAVLPGAVLAVKVDQDNHDEVVIDWSTAPRMGAGASPQPGAARAPEAAMAAVADAGFAASGQRASAEELLRTGRRGTAVLTSVTDIGEIGDLGLAGDDRDLEDDRLYVIGMNVKLPGREPYPAQVGHRVPDRLIGKIGPGLEVQVAVDRTDETTKVAIDWDASLP